MSVPRVVIVFNFKLRLLVRERPKIFCIARVGFHHTPCGKSSQRKGRVDSGNHGQQDMYCV